MQEPLWLLVNDISESSSLLSFLLFADDTNLFISDTDILKKKCDNANRELSKVANWPAANKLSVNAKRTHFVIFLSKEQKADDNLSINVDNQNIEQVNSTNF